MPRFNILTGIITTSILAVVILPLYIIFYLEPSFVQFISDSTEKEAVQVGRHMGDMFFPNPTAFAPQTFSTEMVTELKKLQEEFHIIKVKIFSADGLIIYSTDSQEIGEVNTHDYFLQIVAKGSPFTKIIKKDKISLEGQIMPVDVVETYVPIMRQNTFMGAFEIYYDITIQKNRLHAMVRNGKHSAIAIALLLLMAVLIAVMQASRHIKERIKAENALKDAYENMENKVTERTMELQELNEALHQEIQVRTKAEEDKELLISELKQALTQVKTLSGLLPICSSCQQIRDKNGKWTRVEEYIQKKTDAEFTHGICPKCAKKLYPDLYDQIEE